MKKIGFLFLGLTAILACSKTEQLPSQSLLANTFGVRVHDFTSDVSTKVTTTSYNSTTFNWQKNDKIGVFPLTVDNRQQTTQLGCSLQSGEASQQATFKGTGWGLICNGEYKYASYYPYSEENREDAIKVSFPANLAVINDYTGHIAPYVSMYAPAITPSDVESASFDFYQVGALAHFVIDAPVGVQYTKLVISTSDSVFTTKGTYNLKALTSSKEKPKISPTKRANTIGMSLNTTLAEGKQLNLYFIMAPAQLAGKTLNFKLFDGNNNKYTGTRDCRTNQESGKIYKYSVTLAEEKKTEEFNPNTIEAVDLGHPIYLFAPFNLGATSIEETGDFFAWGEVKSKKTFTKDNYALSESPDKALKDTLINGKTYKVFKPKYDAAAQIWKNDWMVPDYNEINEFLQNQCAKEWVTINGTQGWKCYKKGDKTKSTWIFLPATGIKDGNNVSNTHLGYYWTSLCNGSTYFIEKCAENSPINMGSTASPHQGLAIRPVKFKDQQ